MPSVKDIMQTDVVTVDTDATARDVARILADEEISGVPVLDSKGRLVGVVSATDLVRLAADDAGVRLPVSGLAPGVDSLVDAHDSGEDVLYGYFLPEDSAMSGQGLLEEWPESEFDSVSVRDIMTPVSFSVRPDTPVPELCEFLVRGRIHRAVVVEDGALKGIVTSADVLRAIAEQKVPV